MGGEGEGKEEGEAYMAGSFLTIVPPHRPLHHPTTIDCWLNHMMLDSYDLNGMRNGINGTHPPSGLDPPGIKVRPAQGFEATDYVIGETNG